MNLDEYLFKNKKTTNQRKLAEQLGVTSSYLSGVVTGKKKPSTLLAKKIQELTNGEVLWYEVIDFCMKEQE